MIVQIGSDAEVALLACSGLGLPRSTTLRPLGPRKWASLRERTAEAGLSLDDLPHLDADVLASRLGVDPEQSQRLAGLFARRTQLALELDRLSRLGIWVSTIGGERYPRRLEERLKDSAPPVLFGIGESTLLARGGLAIVGSRDVDEAVSEAARRAGEEAARQDWVLVSGAARGVDTAAMRGASDAGGAVVGVPAEGLERYLKDATIRTAAADGLVAYVSTYRPDAPFSVGAAMGRNKLIYCLSTVAFVVHASEGSGGTWAGATEALEHGWLPVYVLDGASMPPGNRKLIERGARPANLDDLRRLDDLGSAGPTIEPLPVEGEPIQQTLF